CEEEVEDVRKEVAVMERLRDHPHAVQLVATFEDAQSVHLVMELCAGGELWERIKQRRWYDEGSAAAVLRVVVELLRDCHAIGVMHRDLKPENILLCTEENDVDVKVIDFGVAVFFKPGDVYSDIVGSPLYIAPEVLHEAYGPESDIWSAGVILYVLLAGVPPFRGDSDEAVFQAILEQEPDLQRAPWPDVSDEGKDLVLRMLTKDPALRITADDVLDHPWLSM
ncbi:unnamed protein product, partial [Closterium sp. Naga37s-1]